MDAGWRSKRVGKLSREHHLEQIHSQLHNWQDNLPSRIAGETASLDVEIDKLLDRELDEGRQLLHTAHTQVLAACDTVRDLRRRLQDRHPAA